MYSTNRFGVYPTNIECGVNDFWPLCAGGPPFHPPQRVRLEDLIANGYVLENVRNFFCDSLFTLQIRSAKSVMTCGIERNLTYLMSFFAEIRSSLLLTFKPSPWQRTKEHSVLRETLSWAEASPALCE